MDCNSLLIFDTNGILRRLYEVQKVGDEEYRADRACQQTLSGLRRHLNSTFCTHAVAVFDPPGTNWRHEVYPEYKATRPERPPVLVERQPELMSRVREELSMPCLTPPGAEADDLIHWLARDFCKLRDSVVRVMSTDKDLAALIDISTEVFDPFAKHVWDAQWVRDKFGVEPAQIQDYLAMVGDASDNIPGVPGVGPKTASALLTRYGSLARILASEEADAAKVVANARLAELSLTLVQFHCAPPQRFRWTDSMRPTTRPGFAPPFAAMEMAL